MEEEIRRHLLQTLQERFERHRERHPDLDWDQVYSRLTDQDLDAIAWMEKTGGEPDVIRLENRLCYVDCAAQTPAGRRKCCYDEDARRSRRRNAPLTSALEMAQDHGVLVLTEPDYYALQAVNPCDEKTSSWILTPEEIRSLGGALFGDHRYGRTFTYHNGADSWYSSRGFRVMRPIGE